MPIDTLILGFVVLTLGALGSIVLFTELRRRKFQPHRSQDRIFRCQSCNGVYTDDPDVDRSRCPQCGKLNGAIEF